jgi:hypothetical protein
MPGYNSIVYRFVLRTATGRGVVRPPPSHSRPDTASQCLYIRTTQYYVRTYVLPKGGKTSLCQDPTSRSFPNMGRTINSWLSWSTSYYVIELFNRTTELLARFYDQLVLYCLHYASIEYASYVVIRTYEDSIHYVYYVVYVPIRKLASIRQGDRGALITVPSGHAIEKTLDTWTCIKKHPWMREIFTNRLLQVTTNLSYVVNVICQVSEPTSRLHKGSSFFWTTEREYVGRDQLSVREVTGRTPNFLSKWYTYAYEVSGGPSCHGRNWVEATYYVLRRKNQVNE